MSGLPEDTPTPAICEMEGHTWHGSGACVRCGERLRCLCGRYTTEYDLLGHLRVCRVVAARVTTS